MFITGAVMAEVAITAYPGDIAPTIVRGQAQHFSIQWFSVGSLQQNL